MNEQQKKAIESDVTEYGNDLNYVSNIFKRAHIRSAFREGRVSHFKPIEGEKPPIY